MEKKVGDRANCDNLIILYDKSYEENKDNGVWLQRALNRLFNKECMDSELFVKILQQKKQVGSKCFYILLLRNY